MNRTNTLGSTLKVIALTTTLTTAVLLGGCQSTASSQATQTKSSNALSSSMTHGLTRVEENHLVTKIGPDTYVLDSYIIPFQQPYYILIRKQDGTSFLKSTAESIAIDYIKPRGCTEPLKRRSDLDKQNADATQYLIGVSC